MHRRREKRREQRNAAVSALLDRIDATPSLAPPVRGWDLSARSDTIYKEKERTRATDHLSGSMQ